MLKTAEDGMKQIAVTLLGQKHLRNDWFFDFDSAAFQTFFELLSQEMRTLGFELTLVTVSEPVITINSYADLLNSIKVSSSDDCHHRHCIGHIIGKSEQLNIMHDIAKAVKRLAFAPETIAPDAAFAKVCHNCGCGC